MSSQSKEQWENEVKAKIEDHFASAHDRVDQFHIWIKPSRTGANHPNPIKC